MSEKPEYLKRESDKQANESISQSNKQILEEIHYHAKGGNQSNSSPLTQTIAFFSSLLYKLSEQSEKQTHEIIELTQKLVIFTKVLVFFTVALFFFTIFGPIIQIGIEKGIAMIMNKKPEIINTKQNITNNNKTNETIKNQIPIKTDTINTKHSP